MPQRLFTKFPVKINRENISKNRVFLSKNREIWQRAGIVQAGFIGCDGSPKSRDIQ
jgi:hypothetical protein